MTLSLPVSCGSLSLFTWGWGWWARSQPQEGPEHFGVCMKVFSPRDRLGNVRGDPPHTRSLGGPGEPGNRSPLCPCWGYCPKESMGLDPPPKALQRHKGGSGAGARSSQALEQLSLGLRSTPKNLVPIPGILPQSTFLRLPGRRACLPHPTCPLGACSWWRRVERRCP